MTNGDIGFQFQPGARDLMVNTPDGVQQVAPASPQEAVRLLNLRMPRRAAQGQIAPTALLSSPGGAGLETLLALLTQAFAPDRLNVPGLQAPGTGGGRPTQAVAAAPEAYVHQMTSNPNFSGRAPRIIPQDEGRMGAAPPPPIDQPPSMGVGGRGPAKPMLAQKITGLF